MARTEGEQPSEVVRRLNEAYDSQATKQPSNGVVYPEKGAQMATEEDMVARSTTTPGPAMSFGEFSRRYQERTPTRRGVISEER